MTGWDAIVAWWRLTRPTGAVWVALLPLVGYGFAHWDRALTAQRLDALPWVFAAWALLNAGTMWLNAALDHDDGDTLFGRSAPVPPGTARLGYLALLASVATAFAAHPGVGLCNLGCAALAVGYSHPRLVWKGHPWLGPAVNGLGYGLLSPMAGWLLVGVSPNPRTLITAGLLVPWTLGWYFAAQAFQGSEDRARGYRTLVVTHGPRTTVVVAWCCLTGGVAGVFAMALFGWYPRALLLALPVFVVLDRHMRRWSRQPAGGGRQWAVQLARLSLLGGLLMIGLALAEYLRSDLSGEPVAGLNTVAGRPSDRPRLPPILMRQWEATHRR